MSKEKQIEEMAKVMCDRCKVIFDCTSTEMCSECTADAEALYNAGYRKQSEWISVDERLPEEGKNVLCFENGKFYIAFFEKYEEGAWWDWVAFDRDDTWNEVCPSYWMPLPEPPKGE